jgi:Uma2 family endonuclease
MVMATAVPHYTAEEVRNFPDDRLRYEVIRGELFVSPAPGIPHQRVVRDLIVLLHQYLTHNDLGEVLPGPFEVEFTDDSSVQPDVLAILRGRGPQPTRKRLHGPPALVIEIISYSSRRTDRLQKRTLYQEEGVAEYWIADPELKQIERWRPGDSVPEIVTTEISWQPTSDAPPLRIDLASLFRASAK